MSKLPISILILLLTSSFVSCADSEEKAYPGVDPLLWSYFEDFEAEAAARGLEYDLTQMSITGVIEEIETQHVAGSCQYGGTANQHITIDLGFWRRSNAEFKEMVIFHELGHCALFRGHDEGQHRDGTCASIMRSGLGNCRDNYNLSTRSGLLDELFLGY